MEVILTARVENVGDMGEVVNVARGYARNFLIPRGLAVVASKGARKQVAEQVALERKRDDDLRSTAEKVARKYADRELSVSFAVQAGEDDRLFGSVGVRDIAAALAEQGLEFEARQVLLDEPIKQLGVYTVPVKLHQAVEVPVKVWVTRVE
ncbi:MAG: 50S ribosomal protein L9 [Candidatus Krumholzibacteriia bacterium]